MSALLKGATSVLIALALIAIIGTGVILYYNTKDKSEGTTDITEQTMNDNLLPNSEEPQTVSTVTKDPADTQEPTTPSVEGSTADLTQVSSPGSGAAHTHDYTATVAREATCTVMGKMLYTCSCGSYKLEPIPTIPHTPSDWKVGKEVTTKADGTREKRCTVCGTLLNEEKISKNTLSSNSVSKNTVSENVPKHIHKYESKVTTAETCTDDGIATFTCKDCKGTHTEPIPATNHPSRKTIVTEPTCTVEGTTITSCAICKAVISHDTMAVLPHRWGSWKVTTPSTKDAAGVRTRTCKIGDEEETGTIPKLGEPGSGHTHNYNSSSTTEGGCTTVGVKTLTCSCGATKTEEVPVLGHDPGNWETVTEATATTKGVRKKFCRRCKLEVASEEFDYVLDHSHNYVSTVTIAPTCGKEGTRTFTCSICNRDPYTSNIPATGKHTKPSSASGGQYNCTVCGINLGTSP